MNPNFDDIRPYNDAEAVKALRRCSLNPLTLKVSKFLYPDKSPFFLSRQLRKVSGVTDFQASVMYGAIRSIISQTSDGLEVEGVENLRRCGGACIIMSNHRDIVMDPALLQVALMDAGLPCTELCVGSNLLSVRYVRDLMRSNRMIKVLRGLPAHESYEASQTLSAYIRSGVVGQRRSVWIAQREGRAKDGHDATSQAVLKMLDMSGDKSFEANWLELPIVPMTISYEYESCDALRARELLISRDCKYVKKPGEDVHSILTGIRQRKGGIRIIFGEPLRPDEIAAAGALKGNARYKALCAAIDARIVGNRHLWKTNCIAHDILNADSKYAARYSVQELEAFETYMERQLDTVESSLDREELRKIFLGIYAAQA